MSSMSTNVPRQCWRSVGSVAAVVRIYLTGRVAIEADGLVSAGPALGTNQLCALLAILAAERHRAVAAEELADHLWPEERPAAWQQALRSLVSKLRGRLPAVTGVDPVPHWMGCYQLMGGPEVWVDMECARSSIHQAESDLSSGDPAKACGSALVAAAICRDPLLPGWTSAWRDTAQQEVIEIRLRSLQCLAEVWLALGSPSLAIRDAAEVVAREPFREPAYRQLMRAHAAAGSVPEAVDVFRRLTALLATELGVAPSAETISVLEAAVAS